MVSLLLKHEEHYRATQSFLNPPADATIYEIHPDKALHSTLLEQPSNTPLNMITK